MLFGRVFRGWKRGRVGLNVINLPGIKGDALFGTVAGTNTRDTGCPFYAVRPGINVMDIPSRELSGLTRVCTPSGFAPTAVRFISVTNLIGNTSGNRNLNGGFLDRVERISTVVRIIHYFRGSSVARISNDVSPTESVRAVGLRLVLSSLSVLTEEASDHGGTVGNSGAVTPRIRFLRELSTRVRDNGATEDYRVDRSRTRCLGSISLLALGPIVCTYGVDSRSFTGKVSSGTGCGEIRRVTTSRKTRALPVYTRARTRVTALSSRRGGVFLRSLKLRGDKLSELVRGDCRLLNLVSFLATNGGRIQT